MLHCICVFICTSVMNMENILNRIFKHEQEFWLEPALQIASSNRATRFGRTPGGPMAEGLSPADQTMRFPIVWLFVRLPVRISASSLLHVPICVTNTFILQRTICLTRIVFYRHSVFIQISRFVCSAYVRISRTD